MAPVPTPAPIPPDALASCLAPLGEATTLPAAAHISDAVFEWESRHFFADSWVCVGRSADVPHPGDQKALRIGDEGVLITRDQGGIAHVFSNVCRHRGHELLEPDATTNARVIRCPYHAWVYGLDGVLKGAPHFGDSPTFDESNHPLVHLRAVEWHGWLFVDAGGNAPEFHHFVGALDDLVAAHECERLVSVARHDYVVAANWKIITENYHECYHCTQIHPELCRVSPPDSGDDSRPDGAWAGGSMDLFDHAETMSFTGESKGTVLRGLDEVQRRQVYYYSLFPNLLISLHPDYVMTHLIEPLDAHHSRIVCEWLFPPEALEMDGFDPSYAVDFWDVTNKQDWHAVESVQRGARSQGYRQGPLAMIESTTYQFIAMVARSYLEGRVIYPPQFVARTVSPA